MTLVNVFFYGSYMSRAVLRELGLAPATWRVATLPGFDIRIAPRANLVRTQGCSVPGVLATATHAELERLYAHARSALGEVYLPEPVLVLVGEEFKPALCYIAPSMVEAPPERAYVERIVSAGRELGFPAAYIARIESFLSASASPPAS